MFLIRLYITGYIALFPLFLMAEDPWGTDACLVQVTKQAHNTPSRISTPILGPFGEVMIRFHQQVISPADGPRSSFIPSSSQYTLEAMRKYGFFKGFAMGCDRLMRENSEDWVYRTISIGNHTNMKYDPVP